jgi:hypothetical protein
VSEDPAHMLQVDPPSLAVVATAGGEAEAVFVSNVLAAEGIPHYRQARPAPAGTGDEIDILVPLDALAAARRRLRLIPDF